MTVAPHFGQRGFSLIELVLVIVIFSVATVGIMSAFRLNVLGIAGTTTGTTATRLAQERMEIILAQRDVLGFAGLADPCDPGPGPALCVAPPSGYAVVSAITNVDPNTREVSVQVTHNGALRATLVSLITNYS